MILNALLPLLGGTRVVPRSGFGPWLIYVVGGMGGPVDDRRRGNISSAVDLYDPQNASWTQLADMPGPRHAHGCVALEGMLYAVGGVAATGPYDRQELDTAEVYDPQTDGWQPLPKMSTGCGALELAAVGGHDGDEALDSVEAYDPQLGAWARVASMSV